jgi:hypothetical protein
MTAWRWCSVDHLSRDDDWEGFEVSLNRCLWWVYDLRVKRVRTDSPCALAGSGDFYLCPRSAVPVPPAELERWLQPVWERPQSLTPVYRPMPTQE